jgi:outer membrane protein assembly factor BamB
MPRTALTACGFFLIATCAFAETPIQGRAILDAAGVQGGLVVHLGSGNGESTIGLCPNDSYLVHGLDSKQENVDRARRLALAEKLGERVTFDRLNGKKLPYADNVVNLVVVSDPCGISMEEIRRVLASGARACVRDGDDWRIIENPRNDQIDDWTHFLYDATNNAVSKDMVVDQPYHLQWVADPKWARSHDHLATVSAAVSAGGRVFYIADEGSTAAVALPAKWRLVARDAFSGVLLWKRRIDLWEGHLRGFRSGPAELPRRLVAVDDRVYVTLGYGKPLSVLDAATGNTLRVYEGTEGTQEIMVDDGKIYLVAGQQDLAEAARRRGESPPVQAKRMLALNADSGQVIWHKADADTIDLLPLTPALQGDRLYFENPTHVISLNTQTGSELWRAQRRVEKNRWAWSTPTLVIHGDVVISADRAAPEDGAEQPERVNWMVSAAGGEAPPGEMVAFDANSGEELWRGPAKEAYNAPPDVFVTGDTVWSGELVRAREPGITAGRDIASGEITMERARDQEYFAPGMGHHRCYRNKATERFLLLGRSGVELLDVKTGDITAHHYIRGACAYGIFPANGLIYVPSHSCACFIQAKLSGFNALAPKGRYNVPTPSADNERLDKGPAYAATSALAPGASSLETDSWPTYRRDASRSGSTSDAVGSSTDTIWQMDLGGRLTAPVVADGKLLVAQSETHVVHALDSTSGEPAWTFMAGGRIDSPPTVHQGRVLFGSADGYVYCLRAEDGALVWRFLAAPDDRRIVVYDQLESVWPVPGNVLVVDKDDSDATAWFVAGRTSYLDGGMFLYRLNAKTGQMLSVTQIDSRDPETGLPPQKEGGAKGTNMPGALPDVLSCDGESVYMRHTRFDLEGNLLEDDVPHLFSPAGFTDDAWWHRTYWIYGTQMGNGWGGWPKSGYIVPAGRLLVTSDDMVYGFGRLNQYANHGAHVGVPLDLLPWPLADFDNRGRGTTHYRLFASPKEPVLVEAPPMGATKPGRKPRLQQNLKPAWSEAMPLTARAMVLAGDTLHLAGPPELLALSDGTVARQDLDAAQMAYDGDGGAVLCSVSTEDGKLLQQKELDSPPILDGLIAAAGRLYLVTMDGHVSCLGKK